MSIVKIDIPVGYTDAHKERVRQGVKDALHAVLTSVEKSGSNNQKKSIYVSVQESFGEIGDGLPTVIIDGACSELENKGDLCVKLVCDVFETFMNTREVSVLVRGQELTTIAPVGGG